MLVVDGVLPLMINAYGKGDQKKFLIEGSETPQSIPSWVWILIIGIVGWAHLLPHYLFNNETIKFMEETKDILTLEDIKILVDAFYEKVRQDELLAPIFNERIQDRWPQHLEKMYAFLANRITGSADLPWKSVSATCTVTNKSFTLSKMDGAFHSDSRYIIPGRKSR